MNRNKLYCWSRARSNWRCSNCSINSRRKLKGKIPPLDSRNLLPRFNVTEITWLKKRSFTFLLKTLMQALIHCKLQYYFSVFSTYHRNRHRVNSVQSVTGRVVITKKTGNHSFCIFWVMSIWKKLAIIKNGGLPLSNFWQESHS